MNVEGAMTVYEIVVNAEDYGMDDDFIMHLELGLWWAAVGRFYGYVQPAGGSLRAAKNVMWFSSDNIDDEEMLEELTDAKGHEFLHITGIGDESVLEDITYNGERLVKWYRLYSGGVPEIYFYKKEDS